MFVDIRTAKISFLLCAIMWVIHIVSPFFSLCLTFHPSFITFCPLLMLNVYAGHQVRLNWQNKSKQINQMVTSFRPSHDQNFPWWCHLRQTSLTAVIWTECGSGLEMQEDHPGLTIFYLVFLHGEDYQYWPETQSDLVKSGLYYTMLGRRWLADGTTRACI